MTDNFEDVEHQETTQPEEQPAGGTGSKLADAWRTRPIFKLIVVMMVVGALIAAASAFFSGGNKSEQISRLASPPDVHRAPGGSASPYFIQQTKEAEEQREKQALEKGTSALPTPIGQPGDINVTEKSDPMNELRSETEHLKQQLADMQKAQAQRQSQQITQQAMQQTAQQQVAAETHRPPPPPEQFDAALSQAMQGQLRQLMESWTPKGMKEVQVAKVSAEEGKKGEVPSGGGMQQVADASGVLHSADEKPLITAGTVSYAQLLTEANSDVPAPILAQIVSGPLSGARAIGSFQIANGYNDYLVLKFNLADKNGKDYRIDAIALDPDTTLAGMETEVDQRYFTRVIMPAAAAFLQGFGQALGQTSSNVTTNGTSTIISQTSPGTTQGLAYGAAAAANTASQFFQNQANDTKPLVRVAAGTPMGLFFVSSVYEPQAGSEENGGCARGSYPLAPGARLPVGAVSTTTGCYTFPASGAPGAGLYPASVAGQPGYPGYNDVPYPNYGNQNRPAYGSPYGGTGTGSGVYSPSGYSNLYNHY